MNKNLIVMKFGGKSLASTKHFDAIANIIQQRSQSGANLVIVVSAMGQTTDELIALARSVNETPPQREYDMLLSVGERISMALLAMALSKRGIEAISLTGSQSGIITCSTHSDAKIVEIKPFRIIRALAKNQIVIVAGFQGVSQEGEITTLGRGGSDTSAVALGIALDANVIEFYKDVPGFFTKDPKIDPSAEFLRTLSYDEALKILEDGGRILHNRAVEMAQKHFIDLAILPVDESLFAHLKKEDEQLKSLIRSHNKPDSIKKTYERATTQ